MGFNRTDDAMQQEEQTAQGLSYGAWTRKCFTSLLLALLFVAVRSASAQTGQGSISGTVRDSSGAVIQNASVEVVDTETGVQERTKTNKDGLYSIQALNAGNYTVNVTKSGFEQVSTQNIQISTAAATTIDIKLPVGGVNEVIQVNSTDDLLNKDTSEVTTTVDHAIVENLPYPERSSLEAALLVPGVQGDPLQPGGIATENAGAFQGPVLPGAAISIGGAAPGTGSIVVDGSDVTQASYARTGINLSNRMVQETTAIVTGISAKYGRTAGGIIVQSSKPGTNQYHGGITWLHNDPWFNAYPLGTQAKNDQHQNYYGFYVGGPLWIPKLYNGHNKTFFYVGVEPARQRVSYAYRGIFPLPEELQGRIHNSLTLLDQNVLLKQGYAAALAAPRIGTINYQSTFNANGIPNGPFNEALFKQVTGPLADCGAAYATANPTATSCPDDVSLALAHNPFAQFVLSNFPTPSNPGPYAKFDSPDGASQIDGTNGSYSRGVQNTDNRYSIRIDHQLGPNDHFFVRYTAIPNIAVRYYLVAPSNPATIVPKFSAYSRDVAFGLTHVFSNALVDNFHYSFMRNNQQTLPATAGKDYAGAYGLTPATSGSGFPSLNSLNSNGVAYAPQLGGVTNAAIIIDQNFIVGNDLALTHGRHLFQFGGEVRWIQSDQYDLSGSTGGQYRFLGTQTNSNNVGGAPLATFILGTISSFSDTPVNIPGYYRWHYYAGYFQDDWRIFSRLTINWGLRYEVEMPRQEKYNNQLYLRTDIPGSIGGIPANASLCFSKACGNPKTLWPTNFAGIEPRLGISYQLTRNTTFRMAYTMTRLPLTGYENIPDPDLNAPSALITSLTGGTIPANITNYLTNPIAPSSVTSAYTELGGARGPIYLTNLPAVAVSQSRAVPYSQTWSATFQWQPLSKTLVQATYAGLKGTHLIGFFQEYVNTPSVAKVRDAIANHANLGPQVKNAYGITGTGITALNPYQNFATQAIPEIYPRRGDSNYNALYLSVNQRLGRGLSFLTNYTWAKSLDNVPETQTGASTGGFGSAPPQNPFDYKAERSVSSFDQPSRLKAGFTYTLMTGRGRQLNFHSSILNQALGNITVAGIATVQSGLPSSVVLATNIQAGFQSITPVGLNGCVSTSVLYPLPGSPTNHSNSNYCISNALPVGYQLRPNIVKGQPLINKNWKKGVYGIPQSSYFNTAAFEIPGGTNDPEFGDAPRLLSDARSPRETMFDMRFFKSFTVHKKYQVNINATFGNVFNHPVYYGANKSLYVQTPVDPITGQLNKSTDPSITTPHATAQANFGNMNVSNSGGISRVIRVGAEFNF
jgi:hypothetical protein